jgi:hypothetical protein
MRGDPLSRWGDGVSIGAIRHNLQWGGFLRYKYSMQGNDALHVLFNS